MANVFYTLLLFTFIVCNVFSQKVVTGVVKSENDSLSLSAVNITIKGTTRGTISNDKGAYRIQLNENDSVLIFSFLGMQTQEININNKSIVDVVMQKDGISSVSIDEVVITSLEISKTRRSLGYSMAKISDKDITKSGEQNIIQALSAKTTGVEVTSSAGVPGASSKILIRGNTSLTKNNQPLIIVDGIPWDNQTSQTGDGGGNKNLEGVNNSNRALDLSPSDIESVSILKGTAATALYGVRAANGVVIYTTKKNSGESFSANYQYNLEISQVNKLPELQYRYGQGNDGNFNSNVPSSWGEDLSKTNQDAIRNMENFFNAGLSHTHNISFSDRNIFGKYNKGAYRYRVSISHNRSDGFVPNTFYERNSARIFSEVNYKDFTLGGNFSYINSGGSRAVKGNSFAALMLGLFRAPASFNLNDPAQGGYETPEGEQRKYYEDYDNPYWSAYNNTFKDNIDRKVGNANFKYDPVDWFNIKYIFGIDSYLDFRRGITALGSSGGSVGDGKGEVEENTIKNREFYSNFTMSFSTYLNDHIFGTLTLGNNLNEQFYNNIYDRATDFNIPDYNLNNGADIYSSRYEQTIRTSALFFILDVNYENLLYLNATGRNEWASTLPDNSNFFYPAISSSFVFSELLPYSNVLSFGKLRLSWALAGTSPAPYKTSNYYIDPIIGGGSSAGLGFPYLGLDGVSHSPLIGNADLRPEKTIGHEMGIDISFFKNKLELDITYYHQKSIDVLLYRPVSATTGFTHIYDNSAEILNEGIEISLNGDIFNKHPNFSWSSSLGFSTNKNTVLKLADGIEEMNLESSLTTIRSSAIVGEPLGVLFGSKWEKRDEAGNLLLNDAGLPIIAEEYGVVGNPFPDWLANVRNTISYKNTSLSFLFDIRKGGDIWSGTVANLNRLGKSAKSGNREDPYKVEGVIKSSNEWNTDLSISAEDYFSFVEGDFGAAESIIYDGSWIRLRDISLSYFYRFKKDMSKYVKSSTFTFTGRNLLLFTKYPGIDPETSLTGAGSGLTGLDYFNMSNTKSYIFSLQFIF